MSFILVELFEPSLLLEVNDKWWLPHSGFCYMRLATSKFRFRRLFSVPKVNEFLGESILRLERGLISFGNCLFYSVLIAQLGWRDLVGEIGSHTRGASDFASVITVLD